jgi:hypothetical protein
MEVVWYARGTARRGRRDQRYFPLSLPALARSEVSPLESVNLIGLGVAVGLDWNVIRPSPRGGHARET